MDHLRSLFIEALAQEGNLYVRDGRVYIRSNHWAPEEILQGLLDPDAEKDVFLDWVQERKEELIAAADEILNRTEQHDRFLKLLEVFKRGAVIPFVGAGLSIPSGYPGWTAFLRKKRRESTVDEASLEGLIADGKYEEAAQIISDSLRAAFNEAVESAFGCARELAGCVQYLPYVFDTSVITTNFDDVLKRSYENANRPFSEVLSGEHARELPRILGEGRKVLLKLHGTSTTGRGRILTANEYDHHYGTDDGLQIAIEAICTRTLLFMGCSLTVDRTLTAMKAYVDANGHDSVARHYAFLPEPASEPERVTRRDQLVESNIYPIWYPADSQDESIEAFLAKLEEGSR